MEICAGEFNFDEDVGRDPLEDSLPAILSYEPKGVKSS
jgi:hypothetical protein